MLIRTCTEFPYFLYWMLIYHKPITSQAPVISLFTLSGSHWIKPVFGSFGIHANEPMQS